MLLISGLSWNPVPAAYLTVKLRSLSPCKVPVTSPCASPTFLPLLGPSCKEPVTASRWLPDSGTAPHLILDSILPSRVPVPHAEINTLDNQSLNQAPAYKIYLIHISPHYKLSPIRCTSVFLLDQVSVMSDLYSNCDRIHNEQKINQSQSHNTSSFYRSDPVPPRLRLLLVTNNHSLLYKITLTYGTLGYFSATASLYVLSSICVRLHTDIKINQPLSYKTALNYRPDRLPPMLPSSRVVTNQSILYKNAFFYCTPRYFSASHGYVYLYNSYPVPPLNWTVFRKTNLSVAFFY